MRTREDILEELQTLQNQLERETSLARRIALQRRIRQLYMQLERVEMAEIVREVAIDLEEDEQEIAEFVSLLSRLRQSSETEEKFLHTVRELLKTLESTDSQND